jgi:endoplasmic reticulum-Golgi intermediate compartment protein 3
MKVKVLIQVNIDVTFPHLPCFIVSLDVMDVAGEHQNVSRS